MGLLVIGVLIVIFFGFIACACTLALANDTNWESFLKELRDSPNMEEIPEDVVFKVIKKLQLITGILSLIGLCFILCGINLIR